MKVVIIQIKVAEFFALLYSDDPGSSKSALPADPTLLLQDKGKWIAETHRIYECSILASGTACEAGYCVGRKDYGPTRGY